MTDDGPPLTLLRRPVNKQSDSNIILPMDSKIEGPFDLYSPKEKDTISVQSLHANKDRDLCHVPIKCKQPPVERDSC